MENSYKIGGAVLAGLCLVLGATACTTPAQPEDTVTALSVAEQAKAEAAQTGDQTGAQTTNADADDPMICKREAVIGSRFKKEICMRQSDRDIQEQGTQDIMNQRGRGRATANPNN